MKSFKYLLLSIVVITSISCGKKEGHNETSQKLSSVTNSFELVEIEDHQLISSSDIVKIVNDSALSPDLILAFEDKNIADKENLKNFVASNFREITESERLFFLLLRAFNPQSKIDRKDLVSITLSVSKIKRLRFSPHHQKILDRLIEGQLIDAVSRFDKRELDYINSKPLLVTYFANLLAAEYSRELERKHSGHSLVFLKNTIRETALESALDEKILPLLISERNEISKITVEQKEKIDSIKMSTSPYDVEYQLLSEGGEERKEKFEIDSLKKHEVAISKLNLKGSRSTSLLNFKELTTKSNGNSLSLSLNIAHSVKGGYDDAKKTLNRDRSSLISYQIGQLIKIPKCEREIAGCSLLQEINVTRFKPSSDGVINLLLENEQGNQLDISKAGKTTIDRRRGEIKLYVLVELAKNRKGGSSLVSGDQQLKLEITPLVNKSSSPDLRASKNSFALISRALSTTASASTPNLAMTLLLYRVTNELLMSDDEKKFLKDDLNLFTHMSFTGDASASLEKSVAHNPLPLQKSIQAFLKSDATIIKSGDSLYKQLFAKDNLNDDESSFLLNLKAESDNAQLIHRVIIMRVHQKSLREIKMKRMQSDMRNFIASR